MISNIKNISYLTFTQIFIVFVGLLTGMIWSRFGSVEDYGKYQLLMSFVSIVGIFSLPGLGMTAQLSAGKNQHGNLEYIFKKKVLYSIISSFILFFIGNYYLFIKENTDMTYLIYIAACLYPLYNLKALWEGWITATGEFKKLSLIQIYFSLITFIALFGSLILTNNIYFVILSIFFAISLSNIIIIKYVQTKRNNDNTDFDLINYGYKLSIPMAIPIIMSLDKILISEYLTIEKVAIYAIAMAFPSFIKSLYLITNRLLSPKFTSSNSISESWKYFKSKFLLIVVFFTTIGLVGFFILDYLIVLLYTDKYLESTLYAKWIFLFTALSVPCSFLGNILRTQKILKFSYYYESFNSFGKLFLILVLIQEYGLWGIVYAISLMNILSIIFFISYFNYELKKERQNV
ncbi:hypothetical protein CRU98_02795 [Arcobacter sp. CECT 8986]|uniref:lipopolysaccharide biosynthesis protein n=1 Tax=Arcobacter sp. CECT 8986 TaxID=2044507 RepID=UPI001009F08E|nr:oligosaccharide flippase family protein [Arcobacter sp. CECT 8986]RXK00097.1 hypothetical protein CRU98_02795 [Arcobacter sp. CECT 8986]